MEQDYAGIACGECDALSSMESTRCEQCGHELIIPKTAETPRARSYEAERDRGSAAPSPEPSPDASSEEDLMEQARNYVCKECLSPVPSGHKFCGACGTPVPPEVQQLRTDFFGAMQTPGKARLILIRGAQGMDGLSYLLQGTEHVAGRQDAQILFPDDKWISPRHANFIYRGERLVVRDEGSVNGVYVRIKQSASLKPGDQFLCGEQVLRLEQTPKDTSGPAPDGTHFYTSPKRPSPFRLVQVIEGGATGMVFCARESKVYVGREDCDMNFPDDLYISARHCHIEMAGDQFTLHDDGSKNGTYVRINGEQELGHGDYLFVGHQLLRVEMTM